MNIKGKERLREKVGKIVENLDEFSFNSCQKKKKVYIYTMTH